MAWINQQQIFDWKCKKFAGGQDSEDWNIAWDYAIQRLVALANDSEVGLSGVPVPASREDELLIDSKSLGPVCDIIDYFLQETGQWGMVEIPVAEKRFSSAKGCWHTDVMTLAKNNHTLKVGIGRPKHHRHHHDDDDIVV
jgi:hypothetical protein